MIALFKNRKYLGILVAMVILCSITLQRWYTRGYTPLVHTLDGSNRNATVNRFLFNSSLTESILVNGTANVNEVVGCSKSVYIWLNEKDSFHVQLVIDGRLGEFYCKKLPCSVRINYGRDYNQLGESDVAFLFYKSAWDWDELMKHRSRHQKLVFWVSESPRHTDSRVIPPPKYKNVAYDYVMSYRTGVTNRDAVLAGGGYGRYDDSKPTISLNGTMNWAENKTQMVAWVATNCYPHTLSWKRTEFVKALSRHILVDMYGPCGRKQCKDLANCGLQRYKFYLALENSECREYITEKFWYNSLTLGLVPIVYGAPKEDYLRVAPPNSFIHVQDFRSVSELAAYLVKLDKDDELYNQYFEWKTQGSVTYKLQFSNFEPEHLCENVLRRVLDDEAKGTARNSTRKSVVKDWQEWWTNSCHSNGFFPITID